MKMYDIFILSWKEFPSYEGTTARIKGITSSLIKNKFDVCILTPLFNRRTHREIDSEYNIKYIDMRWIGTINNKIYFAKYVALIIFWIWAFLVLLNEIRSKSTIVQYEHIYSSPPAILLKKIKKITIIGDEVKSYVRGEHNLIDIALIAFEAWVLLKTDFIFTSFPNYLKLLQSRFMNKKIIYLPNGIDLPLMMHKDNKKSIKCRNEIIFIGSLGSIDNLKAIECIITIAEKLSINRKDFQITIVGGPLENISYLISHSVVKNGLVKFLGFVSDQKLEYLYKKSFIGLLPFYHQMAHSSQRIKALEYFSRKLLVISSPAALEGFNSINKNIHALIANSPTEMTSLINDCISYPQRYETIAEQGMIEIANRYSWECITQDYIQLICSLF